SLGIRNDHQNVFDLPDDRPFFAIFDSPRLPALLAQCGVRLRQLLDSLRLRATGPQPRSLARPARLAAAVRSSRDFRRINPGRATFVDFPDKFLLTLVQLSEKRRLTCVPFVEGQP